MKVEPDKFVVFQLDGQRYALPVAVVDRVVQVVEIVPLLKMPEYLLGIIDLHGEVVPVINTRYLFGLGQRELDLSDQLIIAKSKSSKYALWVDLSHEVLEILHQEIIPSQGIEMGSRYLKGVVKLEDGLVLISDIDTFLSPTQLNQLEAILKQQTEKAESIIGELDKRR